MKKKSSKSSLRLTLKDTLSCSLSRKHDILLHRNYGGNFLVLKNFFDKSQNIFRFKEGESRENLPNQVLKPPLKKLNCILVVSFSQFSKTVQLNNTDCAFICLCYYNISNKDIRKHSQYYTTIQNQYHTKLVSWPTKYIVYCIYQVIIVYIIQYIQYIVLSA